MAEPFGNKWKKYKIYPTLLTQTGNSVDSIKLNTGESSLKGVQGVQGLQGLQGLQGPAAAPASEFPVGGIIMWSGQIADIPVGWALCDGNDDTPDLVDKFIVGVGGDYQPGDQGGSRDSVLVEHTHTVTDPGHSHGMIRKWSTGQTEPSNLGSGNDGGNMSSSGDTDQATTGISNSTEGVDGTNTNLPPYYALAYIMKLATN